MTRVQKRIVMRRSWIALILVTGLAGCVAAPTQYISSAERGAKQPRKRHTIAPVRKYLGAKAAIVADDVSLLLRFERFESGVRECHNTSCLGP